jgi:nucleoside-diphosphate-sugar epimerase
MSERVVITGGAGFIGSNLAEGFLRRGYSVRVVDNLSTGTLANFVSIRKDIDFRQIDIRDLDACIDAFRGIEVVLHHAGISSVARSIQDPISTHAVNVNGTLNVLLAAQKSGVKKVINASSSSVYGNTEAAANSEDLLPSPLSPYGLSKWETELHTSLFARTTDLETVSLRYFNVFGPRQSLSSGYGAVIPLFIKNLAAGARPTIYGDGQQTRDFTFVENVVEANARAIRTSLPPGATLNVGTGKTLSLNDLAALLNEIFGSHIESTFGQPRTGDINHSCGDITLSEGFLGSYNSVTLRDGLLATARWYLKSIGRVQHCE